MGRFLFALLLCLTLVAVLSYFVAEVTHSAVKGPLALFITVVALVLTYIMIGARRERRRRGRY